ncbi:MAG: helix-turn-helix domain-containing protein, partial [Spirochaetales bacterium]|nr:helix-turn-helix domain-containing protein [Spirochaetales bacterium]
MAIQRQEVINYSSTGPLKLFIHKLGNVTKHWHKNLEILMVLDGRVNVSSEGSLYELESDDVIVISPNQIHELNSDGCIMLAAQIDMTYLDDSLSDYDRYLFNCSSRECPEKMVHFNRIKELLALMVKANSSETPSLQSKNLSYIYGIISILTEHFQTEPKPDQRSKKDLLRLNRILKYINNHYTSNLSLSELAEMEGITVPYLSTYFKKCMGVTFSEYNNEVKLMNAVEDMLSSSEPISTISSRHGFNDPHSFIRSFKKRYKTLPSAYREKKKDEIEKKKTGEESKVNYISVELNNYLHLLGKHLPSERNTTPREQSRSKSVITFPEVSFNNVIKQNRHHFKRVIGVGKAKDILQSSIQAMIRDLQNSIGFESIKFHGILSDDMHIISRNTKGLSFHFNLIDEVIDFLLSVKLKPIINLSFMPEELARDKNKTVFTSKFITSEPADINEWKLLIRNLVTHLM